jgi:hypothetical protein
VQIKNLPRCTRRDALERRRSTTPFIECGTKLSSPTTSSSGHSRLGHILPYARFGSKASFSPSVDDFRSTPNNGYHQTGSVGPVRARSGLMQRSKQQAPACAWPRSRRYQPHAIARRPPTAARTQRRPTDCRSGSMPVRFIDSPRSRPAIPADTARHKSRQRRMAAYIARQRYRSVACR